MDENHDHEHMMEKIKLDGSLGVGDNALLTIITKDETAGGDREETFQFPYHLIDFNILNKYMLFKLLMGYKIIRQEKVREEVL
jgi:hypothetical protein